MEFILEKKFVRHKAESSLPDELVIRVHVKRKPLVRGESWTPLVAEFFMELYPDFIESGLSLDDLDLDILGESYE
ncbi:MAG: hypothetical protein RBS30_08375 [Sphaerochaetaceae bacterium]|jgi:hypothetical protein|nr:hypothetical protein [Sphaerochaetaceae bacterium]